MSLDFLICKMGIVTPLCHSHRVVISSLSTWLDPRAGVTNLAAQGASSQNQLTVSWHGGQSWGVSGEGHEWGKGGGGEESFKW